jgi:ABC-2 type transport system permease protein
MTFRLARLLAAGAARRLLAEPASLTTTTLVYLTVTSALASLWRAAAGANGGSVAGYPAAALVCYAAMAEAAMIPVHPRLIETVGSDITSGRLMPELLRPRSMLAVRVVDELGAAVVNAGLCVAIGVVLVLLLGGRPEDPAAVALAVPSLLLGLILSLVVQHAAAGSAFWVGDVTSAWFLYQKLVFLIGGMMWPLEVLPSSLATVAWATPFPLMVYAPARLASGHWEPWLLAAQVGWLVVAWVVASAVFSCGERRLVRAGA